MDFDGLDDILDDNSYVPSFAGRDTKKNDSMKIRKNSAMQNQSIPVNPINTMSNNTRSGGGLLGLHKQSSRNQPTTFQDFFNKQKDGEKKGNSLSLQKNKSASNFNLQKIEKQDDADSIFSAQRTNNRRPFSKQKQSQKQSDKVEVEPVAPRRGMKPPLSKKNETSKTDLGIKMDTINSFDVTDNFNSTKQVQPKYVDKLDPLESLKNQQGIQMKKFLQQQIEYQKKTMQSILEQERQSKKKQIESLKRSHEEQLRKKIQLKDYEITKLKQFYQIQLNLKTTSLTEKKDLAHASQKIDENLKQLKKIQIKMNEQYSALQNKQSKQISIQMERRENALERREKELKQKQRRLQQLEKELKSEKSRLYQQQDRQRSRLNEQDMKTNQREHELETKYKKKQKELSDEYDKKRSQLDHQKQKMRYESLENQQKKLQIEEQQRELKKKTKSFEDRQRQILEQLHQQRSKQMEKQIEISNQINDVSMKQNQVEMERQQLTNKLKILELERKKMEIQSKGALKSVLNSSDSSMDKVPYWNKRDQKAGLGTSFESYHKTITQMRDQLMKSIPKF